MTSEDELDDARRAFDSASSKVGKSGYLAGNGGEKLYSTTYMKYAQMNNSMGDRPHKVILKKKYRRG